jgi:hypothetical protein
MVSKPRARRWRPTKNQRQSNMLQFNNLDRAGVAELADAQDLGSCGRKVVEVQVLSPAPISFPQLRWARPFVV